MSTDTQKPEALTGCACRWDKDDNRVQTCERHQGWLDVVHEWAERAKAAEAELDRLRQAQGGEAVARLHVGDSRFEMWYGDEFEAKNKGTKQQMREAYEAGMNDPITSPPLQADACKVPLGLKLVPVNPTKEMIFSGIPERTSYGYQYAEACYRAMLNAAPQPAAPMPEPCRREQRGPNEYTCDCKPGECVNAAPTQVETQWQPIETAPKDGQSILVWRAGRFNSVEKTCFYNGELLLPSKEQQESVTHWMPLPAAPSTPPMEQK